jgi:hypothetical protein
VQAAAAAGLAALRDAVQSPTLLAVMAAHMAAAAAEEVFLPADAVAYQTLMGPAVRALKAQSVSSGLVAHAAHLHSHQHASEHKTWQLFQASFLR